MLELLLVRHAVAYERDRKRWRNDDLRSLTPKGMKKFRQAAGKLRKRIEAPDALWSSPLVRACQTAELLHLGAGWPAAQVCEALSPRGSPGDILDFLDKQSDTRIALVGHEPGLSALASTCLTGKDDGVSIRFKKGAVLCLSFPRRARAGQATLLWLLTN